MPTNLCKAFIEGYWSGDGCYTNDIYKATTVSKKLVYGLGQLIAKSYHRPFSIYFTKRKPTCIIEGRTVNQKNSYSITFNKKNSKQDKAFYEDGYIWFPIKNICCTNEIKPVYDITVKNCHSFTANGAIAHNCTDISLAGKMKGLSPSDSTRSSLLWENIRLLKTAKDDETLPKYIMFENVKNLVGKKFINDFKNLLSVLDELGFNSYWKVLNAKNCGVPQNRERVFVISIRKDVDNEAFVFPKPFDTGIRLKDILDENVDEKYYLSKDVQSRFKFTSQDFSKNVIGTTKPISRSIGQRDLVYSKEAIMGTLVATDYKQPKQVFEQIPNECVQEGNLSGEKWNKMYESSRRYYSVNGCSPTIHTCNGGNTEPKISEPLKGYSKCLKAEPNDTGVVCNYRIRKLTPNECWKLMGLTEDDCTKAVAIGGSDSQLYKQAGNGIVTNCCELLAEHLYKAQYDGTYVCTDENFINPQLK